MTSPVPPPCIVCRHFRQLTSPPACAAFPSGIPEAVFDSERTHYTPIPGDNGIVFELAPGETMDVIEAELRPSPELP